MRLDKLSKLFLYKREFEIIASIVNAFSLQIDWQYESFKNERLFKKNFEKKFHFQLIELGYLISEIWSAGHNLEHANMVEEICIFFFQEQIPNKPLVIYTALTECAKNFEDYEISIIAGVSRQELDNTIKEFKEKIVNIIKERN